METGGAQILAIDLLNEMCAQHNVSLIVVNNKFNKNLLSKLNKFIKVYYLNRVEGSKNPLPILKLNLLLYRLKPAVIHCHEPNMGAVIKYRQAKLIYTIHDVGIRSGYFSRYNTLVAISDAVKSDLAANGDFNICTIYNGIADQLFAKRIGYLLLDKQPIRLVQISRLVHEKKGQDILLTALAKIKQEGFDNFTLDIVGEGNSMQYLVQLSSTLGLQDNVQFVGEKDRDWVYKNLCNYHLLVQPSRYEGFGLTLIEGFAAGLLVLASAIDGPLEIISKTPRGFVFENENIDDCTLMLKKIMKLYMENQVQRIIDSSENLAETIYSIKICAEKYLKEYV